jgi:hypothetical protein
VRKPGPGPLSESLSHGCAIARLAARFGRQILGFKELTFSTRA